jgi:hypothetical protein
MKVKQRKYKRLALQRGVGLHEDITGAWTRMRIAAARALALDTG